MAISLQKGQKISLEKSNGSSLTNLCVGVNWGAITKKGFFGTKTVAVDLDASCAVFDANKTLLDVVYFGKLKSTGIQHSGDDRTGDTDGDDGLDNEVINVNLSQLPANADQVVFVLNSFSGDDFKTIPFASIRLYEGTPTRVDSIHAVYDIANDAKFAGSVSMVLGKLYKHNGSWKFSALGETTNDKKLEQTVKTVETGYL
ncbi:TerD family protein [Psychromonas sp. SP041]|uniref:TerD family protein n=1 Tax=Psychromonas sp. SP041 TaxID=1365007 RepID=UPI000425BC9D|nr:TerD family protein [Psychromonas sp. SP041]